MAHHKAEKYHVLRVKSDCDSIAEEQTSTALSFTVNGENLNIIDFKLNDIAPDSIVTATITVPVSFG